MWSLVFCYPHCVLMFICSRQKGVEEMAAPNCVYYEFFLKSDPNKKWSVGVFEFETVQRLQHCLAHDEKRVPDMLHMFKQVLFFQGFKFTVFTASVLYITTKNTLWKYDNRFTRCHVKATFLFGVRVLISCGLWAFRGEPPIKYEVVICSINPPKNVWRVSGAKFDCLLGFLVNTFFPG